MELLTLKEAHRELNGKVSLSSLYLAIENRSLPHYRVSARRKRGKILICREDLLAWLEGQKVGASGEHGPKSPPAISEVTRRHLQV